MGFLKRIWRSLENPSTSLSDPDEWLYDALGASTSASGVRVGRDAALSYSPVWRGTFIIANAVAKLPLYVYERDDDGEGKHYASEHAAYGVCRRKPNSEMTAMPFRRAVQAQAILEGNGYSYIARAGNGDPLELIPLLPGTCNPIRVEGVLWYVVRTPDGAERKVPASDILHIKGPGLDALLGDRMIHRAKDSLGGGIAQQLFAAKFFANGMSPSAVIEHPKTLGAPALKNLRESWSLLHQGLENSHKLAILEEGMKLSAYSISPDKAQLVDSRKFSVKDVANWLQLPPHLLGDDSKSGYNSLESENQSFLDHSLDPWLVIWEEECFDKLLTEEEKRSESHTVEFMRLGLLRADAAARSTYYHNAVQDGWMNNDEIRARENLNPIPDGNGKRFYRPLNMAAIGQEEDDKQLDFQREAWLGFQADGTVADVMANLSDMKALTKAVGLPTNEEYVDPYLPVTADTGPLVTGDPIVDKDGDIVGSGVKVNPGAVAGAKKDNQSGAANANDGGKGQERAVKVRAVRIALHTTTRQMILDATGRMVRRLRTHAVKAARSEGEFREFLARGMDTHRAVFIETIGPAMVAAGAARGVSVKPEQHVDGLMAELRRRIAATDGSVAAVEAALAIEEKDNG